MQRADPAYRRRQILRPRQAQLPGMTFETAQRVEPSRRYISQRVLDDFLHATALARISEPPDEASYRFRLAGLGELLEVGEVHALAAQLYGV